MTDGEKIETLKATRERLFNYGWHKGNMGPSSGPNCVVGAISVVTGRGVYGRSHQEHQAIWMYQVMPVVEELADALSQDCHYRNVASYNDNPETNFDDIINLIDRSIKTLESENNGN